ncbi:HDOD domain-containing protein [bacterium]|nr:HDOD domain-containing protein [bacterium]
MAALRTILFVDDEPNILSAIRRALRTFRDQWNMLFAEGAEAALAILKKRKVDAIVTDMKMPGINGAQLLNVIQERHPDVIRIILSGQSDEESLQQSVTRSHQFFSKPCDPTELFRTVHRSCVLRDRLSSHVLKELVSRTNTLPSIPKVYSQVVDELNSPSACVRTVAELISQDVAMSTKLLQLINSSFFSLKGRIESPAQAAALLGINVLRPIVLTVGIFSQFHVRDENAFSLEGFSEHSLAVGKAAELIARDFGAPKQVIDDSQMAGLIHDVGQLLLASRLPDEYDRCHHAVLDSGQGFGVAERQFFGTSSSDIGAHLLGLWGLPQPIVEAVAYHHNPSEIDTRTFTPLLAVHIANSLVNETPMANPIECRPEIDSQWIEEIGFAENLPAWRDLVFTTFCKDTSDE